VTATAPLDRLSPQDFYRLLDGLRDEWETLDEYVVARRLQNLRRMYEHLPTRFWTLAEPLLKDLGMARVANGRPWYATLRQLSEIVATWTRAQPPLLSCPECGHDVRGHQALETHRYVVHDVEVAA